ncbi:MAG: hypothetical protein HC848_03920 [Limnobacter sp.]|nr:hypothetical protein [Limnobacter sp.]
MAYYHAYAREQFQHCPNIQLPEATDFVYLREHDLTLHADSLGQKPIVATPTAQWIDFLKNKLNLNRFRPTSAKQKLCMETAERPFSDTH